MASQVRRASSQPRAGAMIMPRAYRPRNPVSGSLNIRRAATAPMPTRTAVPIQELCLPSLAARDLRSWKSPSHKSRPGRNSTPQTSMISRSLRSRSLRMCEAARQCSTTVWGSAPKDWMRGLRSGPRARASTARQKASPRLGSKREIFGGLTVAGWFSLLAVSILSSLLSLPPSRYAAEARALVAAVCPPPPCSGTCAPGLKSNPSSATAAPIAVRSCSFGAPKSLSADPTPWSWDREMPPTASWLGGRPTWCYTNQVPFSACSRTFSAICGGIGSWRAYARAKRPVPCETERSSTA